MAVKNDQVFGMDILERAPNLKGTVSGASSSVSAKTVGILKPSLRESYIQPMDMMQVWFRRRFSSGYSFPNDYYPAFTGFVDRVTVSYSGSQIGVTVSAEDVGRLLRVTRVNVDPAVSQSFRPTGINVTPYNNYLNSPTFSTGAAIIEALVRGSEGVFLGLSQVEITTRVQNELQNNQEISTIQTVSSDFRTRVARLATDFEKIYLNLFEDLCNQWKPYVNEFKSAFNLWEPDYKTKWDICKEVADITEFEWYADNLGILNYHPPLYSLNPFGPQYLIDNVDIKDESHVVDEKKIITVATINSQASYGMTPLMNTAQNASSMVQTNESLIQRFGVRWAKKVVPIFSGVDTAPPGTAGVGKATTPNDIHRGRTTYARSWLNRRNAEFKSADVTITGTPEIRVCNTIAFVGNAQDRLRNLVGGQRAGVLSVAAIQQSIMRAIKGGSISGAATFPSLNKTSVAQTAMFGMDDVMVYYVSGVTNSYQQGSQMVTKLNLTHGRYWSDPLPFGGVGYGLDAADTNEAVEVLRKYFGQDGANVPEFAKKLSNALNFIATGNPDFLDKPKANAPTSVLSLTPGKTPTRAAIPVAQPTFGNIEKSVHPCRTLYTPADLKAKAASLRKSQASMKATYDQFMKSGRALVSQGVEKLQAIAQNIKNASSAQAVVDLASKKAGKIEVDPTYPILKAALGSGQVKVQQLGMFDAGNLIPSSVTSIISGLGLNLGSIALVPEPVIAYGFVAQSTDGTVESAQSLAQKAAMEAAIGTFNQNPPVIGTQTLTISADNVKAFGPYVQSTGKKRVSTQQPDGTSKTTQELLVQGITIMARNTKC
jgi:hypothetical protein